MLNKTYQLPLEIIRHIQVLRVKIADTIILFNGDNLDYHARIMSMDKKNTIVVIDKIITNNNYNSQELHLAISIIAMDNLELVLRSSVELGVTHIKLFNSSRTQRINKERLTNKLERWQQIIISACEQTHLSKLPTLDNTIYEFNQIISMNSYSSKILLSPWHESQYIVTQDPQSKLIIIGPEGGFTPDEVVTAEQNGCRFLKLGSRVLRAETAALAAISYIQSTTGEWI